MALSMHDSLGLAAGALTTVAFVPQIVRILATRSPDEGPSRGGRAPSGGGAQRFGGVHHAYDISWWLFGILAAGSVLWLWYGIRLESLPLIATNVVTLSLQLAIFWLKWRYGRVPRGAIAGIPEER
jgi:MtN3 and saliva related transmembrane protein